MSPRTFYVQVYAYDAPGQAPRWWGFLAGAASLEAAAEQTRATWQQYQPAGSVLEIEAREATQAPGTVECVH